MNTLVYVMFVRYAYHQSFVLYIAACSATCGVYVCRTFSSLFAERYISFTRPLAYEQTLYGVFHVQVQLAKMSTFVNYLSRKPISYFFVTDQNSMLISAYAECTVPIFNPNLNDKYLLHTYVCVYICTYVGK